MSRTLFMTWIMPSTGTEDEYEIVVPISAIVSIDTFVQLFCRQAFCLIKGMHHA